MSDTFESELARLLNKYSIDSACNTPDFILAEFVARIIDAKMQTNARVDAWKGERGNIASGALRATDEDRYAITLFADANDYGQLLRYLAGAASVCWKDIDGERVFNAEKADEICKIAEARLKDIAKEQLSSMSSRVFGHLEDGSSSGHVYGGNDA